jgi:hypothetical protein
MVVIEQGNTRATSAECHRGASNLTGVIEVGTMPEPIGPVAHIKSRILTILGQPWAPYGQLLDPPGSMSWHQVRVRIGGKFRQADFVAAVGQLLAEGEIIEVWLQRRGRSSPAHLLMMPGCSDSLDYPIRKAKGRAEVLASEPWYAGVCGSVR